MSVTISVLLESARLLNPAEWARASRAAQAAPDIERERRRAERRAWKT